MLAKVFVGLGKEYGHKRTGRLQTWRKVLKQCIRAAEGCDGAPKSDGGLGTGPDSTAF